jgi:hypothetical protein
MSRVPLALLLLAGGLALAGCGTPNAQTTAAATLNAPLAARVFLEARSGEASATVVLPESGVAVALSPQPVLLETDFADADVAEVEFGRCLLLRLRPAAAADLHRLSVEARGRRLVLALNDEFLGARRLEGALEDGALLIFLEVPDERLPVIAAQVKRTSLALTAVAQQARRGNETAAK